MLDVRPLDLSPPGLERTAELLQKVFPVARHITPAYLDRLYNGNPLGETWGFSAFDEGELVGHTVNIAVQTRLFGDVEPGYWPFQLATRPGYRGKGLFSALMEHSMETGRVRGCTHAVGVGNDQSTPIFVKKWAYQAVRQLDVRICLGTAPVHRPGAAGLDLERVWDAESIAWRLTHPAVPYRVHWRGDTGHLFAPTGRLGIEVEIAAFARRDLPEDLPPLRGVNPFRLWIGVDPTRDWSRTLHFDVPRRFWPSPLHLLIYDLTDRKRLWNPDRVRFEVFDFDAY
jgi:GNAT superfamily N-acetyltransferase